MSLTLLLQPTVCPTCSHQEKGNDFNVTYNLSDMWYHCFPGDGEIIPIENMTAKESLHLIDKAVKMFIEHEKHLRTLDPPIGWGGSYEQFLKTLRSMRNACEDHPEWIWKCWR